MHICIIFNQNGSQIVFTTCMYTCQSEFVMTNTRHSVLFHAHNYIICVRTTFEWTLFIIKPRFTFECEYNTRRLLYWCWVFSVARISISRSITHTNMTINHQYRRKPEQKPSVCWDEHVVKVRYGAWNEKQIHKIRHFDAGFFTFLRFNRSSMIIYDNNYSWNKTFQTKGSSW
jgi:hypothetical protein